MAAGTTRSESLSVGSSETGRPRRRGARLRVGYVLSIAAVLFLVVHLAHLAPTLDDIDAVNFAFGLRAFDPAEHHPHPPGYPVYVVLGKAAAPIARLLRPPDRLAPLHRDSAALALAFWSALFGAICLLASYAVFRRLETLVVAGEGGPHGDSRASPPGDNSIALWAAILAAASPLAWLTASRPMSDVPGLAGALIAQALLLEAWIAERKAGALRHAVSRPLRAVSPSSEALSGSRQASVRDPLLLGAVTSGLALGVRSQVLWLTLPLLVAVLVVRARRRGLFAVIPGAGAYAASVVGWFVPMLAVTGWQRYLAALGGQGAEDFSGVDMLWTHFGARRFAAGLWQTFVLPWDSPVLAAVVLFGALTGIAILWRRARPALALLALLAAPYAVFHTLFHETITTRYALPLLPPVCYLAVRGFASAGRRIGVALLVGVVASSLVIGVVATRGYAAAPSPIFAALGVLEARSAAGDGGAILGMHRRVSTEAKPALAWADVAPWSRRLPSPRHQEWIQALGVLREEPDRTVWFLTEPARRGELRVRDLALIDPRGVRAFDEFRWNVSAAGPLGGVRPDIVDLYEIRQPGWIAGEGWALTPATAGMAEKTRRGPFYGPIEALVRRRPDETVMLIGGRHLGGAAEGAAKVELRMDGQPVGDFVVDPEPRFFLKMLKLPAGALSGAGTFGTLSLSAHAVNAASRPVRISIEQFDIDGANGLLAGYDTGWQENEYDTSRQQLWRWASERATVLVHAGGTGPLTLRLIGESPRKYFDRPSTVRIRVGDEVLWTLTPDARLPRLLTRLVGAGTFSAAVRIDRDALARASGRLTLETDQFFVPADRGQGDDRRHLALRVLNLQIVSGRTRF